jgi:Fe-S cluster assembly protein SufB
MAPKGLSEDTIRFISAKKDEPEWMLEWRLDAFKRWQTDGRAGLGARRAIRRSISGHLLLRGAEGHDRPEEPRRGRSGTAGDLREARHSAARAGNPGRRAQAGRAEPNRPTVAVDAVFDSVSVVTTFKEELAKAGVIFCRSPKRCASIRNW